MSKYLTSGELKMKLLVMLLLYVMGEILVGMCQALQLLGWIEQKKILPNLSKLYLNISQGKYKDEEQLG